MSFNHDKLIARIVELFRTRRAFANHIGWTDTKLSARLNNAIPLDADEIHLIKDALNIPDEEIVAYFFTP
jgi:hypothetical protein